MNRDPLELLSAFMDGEAVDPAVLAEAFAVPGAKEALRDFALLRAEVLADDSRPTSAFYTRMTGLFASSPPHRSWWAVAVPVPALALAAAAVLVVALGVWAWRAPGLPTSHIFDAPPAPDRVVVFRPGVDWKSYSGSPAEPRIER